MLYAFQHLIRNFTYAYCTTYFAVVTCVLPLFQKKIAHCIVM